MQKCILKWLVSVSESASERIRTFQLPQILHFSIEICLIKSHGIFKPTCLVFAGPVT